MNSFVSNSSTLTRTMGTPMTTKTASKPWGPAWLHEKFLPASHHECPPHNLKHDPQADAGTAAAEYSEQCWQQMPERDYAYLMRPRGNAPPCAWCGGRLVHSRACNELVKSWDLIMPYGKHKGRPLSEVPLDYLEWLLVRPGLDAQLAASIRKRVRSGKPER